MSRSRQRGAIVLIALGALGWMGFLAFRWYKTGPLIEAEQFLRHRTAADVVALLGEPRYEWSKLTSTYPVSGYSQPPLIKFSRATA